MLPSSQQSREIAALDQEEGIFDWSCMPSGLVEVETLDGDWYEIRRDGARRLLPAQCRCGTDCEWPCWQREGITTTACCPGCPKVPA